MNEVYKQMKRRLSVKIIDETFNIKLLSALSKIRNILMDVDFKCNNQRV